jgi:hypothetical protein
MDRLLDSNKLKHRLGTILLDETGIVNMWNGQTAIGYSLRRVVGQENPSSDFGWNPGSYRCLGLAAQLHSAPLGAMQLPY